MGKHSYNEALLHWIWEKQQLEDPLYTINGEEIIVHRQGKLNTTDGPDFINAEVSVGPLRWYGDVEIHWEGSDWFRHGHQHDVNYERVILHVVYESEISRKRMPSLPTLCMEPYLKQPLADLLSALTSSNGLPCSQILSFISPAALEAQIAKAHLQYFDRKVDELLHFYDPELPPSQAWQQMLIVALFDGLGIAHNREPMRKLARRLIDVYSGSSSLTKFKKEAEKEALDYPKYRWKQKGSRPANRSEVRIEQGCELMWHILGKPFDHWFNSDPRFSFKECVQEVTGKPKLGKERAGILFGIVWLPAIYLLGELFGFAKIASAARQAWIKHRTALPASVRQPFQEAGIPDFVYSQKLGAVHHFKRYCRERRCHQCEVFKSAVTA